MYYVGLDVHHRISTFCILDGRGQVVKRQTVRGGWHSVVKELREQPGPLSVCFEASCGYGPLYDGLASFASRVVMAHPGQLRLIFRAKRKNDRIDAKKLAKLLYLDEVPAAYVPSTDVRQWRELIEFRRRLVDRQTVCKNQIRALLRSAGVAAPKGLWTRAGLRWLDDLAWPSLCRRIRPDLLLDDYRVNCRRIRTVTAALDSIARRHPGVILLRTIPGVGPARPRRSWRILIGWSDSRVRGRWRRTSGWCRRRTPARA